MSTLFAKQTPNTKRCIFHSGENEIQTNFGVTFKLDYPVLPFAFFCGSKKKPSDLHVSVSWKGEWSTPADLVTMDVKINDKKHAPIQRNPNQNMIDTVIKLNSGSELRPVPFSVTITIQSKTKTETYVIKDTHCVLMTAPSTQRRKALSNLAWSQLSQFHSEYSPSMKANDKESVCDTKYLGEILQGRWDEMFEQKHPFPYEFIQLLSELSKDSFFHSSLASNRQPGDYLEHRLKQKEFKKIWSWYEAVFSFIEEYPALFFTLNIPKIQSRINCETNLQRVSNANDSTTLFTVRFASEEDVVGLSVFKQDIGCVHTAFPFKKIEDLIAYIKILEDRKFKFIDYIKLKDECLFPKLSNLSVFF